MIGSPNEVHGYHAHIYYNNDSFNNTRSIAEKLRDTLESNFPVKTGKSSGITGPHPAPQIQITFKKEAFQSVVSWLMLNRQGLDILIHPLTDDEYEDHTANALWLGRPVRLHLGTLPHTGYRAEMLPRPNLVVE